ncbi:sugar ABC transporter permease [Spirochaetia bacterium]|nr:sugar ABC transporter permease [Spirochaetia bacterium]
MNQLKPNSYRIGKDASTQLQLKIMLLPAVLSIIVFNIVPLFGLIIAFKNYRPSSGMVGIFTSAWSGLRNFRIIFRNYDFWPMMINTLGINLLGNFIGIPVTLAFALMLNEVKNTKLKGMVQTATYMPHFISWVVYGGLFITLLSTEGGFVNTVLVNLGFIDAPIAFMADPKYFWGITVITGLLKELGWGAILYLAAMAGIDQELYEAAMIDGSGRFGKMWHITIPSIKPTLMIMIIFAVSGMLNNNFTQIYVLQNTLNISRSQVIDTYIYQIGLQQLQFGTATAVGLTKSILAVLLLSGANWVSKKLIDSGLF